jgi:hypothetical protein
MTGCRTATLTGRGGILISVIAFNPSAQPKMLDATVNWPRIAVLKGQGPPPSFQRTAVPKPRDVDLIGRLPLP